jgi:hypothetical protein
MPLFTDTVTLPVPAPIGTLAVNCVAVAAVIVAGLPLKKTLLLAIVVLNAVPVITTLVLNGPAVVLRAVTVGVGLLSGGVADSFFEHEEKRTINSIKIEEIGLRIYFMV